MRLELGILLDQPCDVVIVLNYPVSTGSLEESGEKIGHLGEEIGMKIKKNQRRNEMIIKSYGSCGIGTKNELLGVSTKEEEKEKEKRKKKRKKKKEKKRKEKKRKEKRFQNSKIRKIKEITSLWLSREG